MDPVTILGTAGAVADIVGVITNTIKVLDELRDRWKKVELTIVNLRSQLTSLRAALNEISEWMQSDLAHVPQHHQLVIDLDQSISCCRLLVNSMEVFLSNLNIRDDGNLDLGQKIRTVFQTKGYKEFQEFISHQTNALNLLLSACNCKTLSEQKSLLEKSANRNIFERVREDSSSLLVIYDDESFCSSATQSTGSSKISRIFPFDTILMSSSVYQRAIRSLLQRYRLQRRTETVIEKTEVQKEHQITPVVQSASRVTSNREVETSKSIDSRLEKDKEAMQRTFKLVILGGPEETMHFFMILLRTISPTEFHDMVQTRKTEITSGLIDCIYVLLDNFKGDWQSLQQRSIEIFRQQTASSIKITPVLSLAILRIWYSSHGCLPSYLSALSLLPRYFLENIERIINPDYVPTLADILHLPSSSGIQEMAFHIGELHYNVLLLGTLQTEPKKWMHQIEDVFAVLFVVDCFPYNRVMMEPNDQNNEIALFEKTENLFKSILNSRWVQNTAVLVCFCHADLLRERHQASNFSDFISDYQGGANVSEASAYMADRFQRLAHDSDVRKKREISTCFVNLDSEDSQLMKILHSFVKDRIIKEYLDKFIFKLHKHHK